MNRLLADELREMAAEGECFNNVRQPGEACAPAARDMVRRSVLDAARKYQEESAKAGAKTSARYRYSLAYNRPLESIAAGVHSRQAREFTEMYRKHGITGAYHKPDGTAVFETRGARNAVLALRGLYDRDAGYGDFNGNAKDD